MASGENLGAKFTLDITNLKAGLAEANKMIRQSESEFVEAAAGMNNWSQSADGLAKRVETLNKQVDIQKQKISALLTVKEQTIAKMQKEGASNEEIAASVDKVNAQLAKEQKQLETLQSKADKADKELTDFNETQGEAADGSKKLADGINDAADAANNSAGGFTVMKGALANLVSQGISAAAGALKNFASDVVKTGMEFDASMSKVAALSGATGEELQLLEDTAREFGSTTQFSASEAADALGYMALAGWDAQQSADALGGVLDLAAAGGMDLAQASDMVTDYLSAFGMEASQSAELADLLAYAQANSNTSAEQLGEAYKNCAANLNASGQSVQTTTALLASMANQGLKGSEAGTALTAVVRDMTAKMKDGAIAIGDTNVEVMDAQGNYRDLTDILADVEAATDGMGDAERATALSSTFTADSIKGLNLILNEGVASAAAFEEELNNSSGSAAEMAAKMNDNLSGDLKSLSSAFDELKLSIFDSANAPLRDLVQTVSGSVLPAFTDMINGVEGADVAFGEALGNLVTTAISNIVDMLPQILQIGNTLLISLIQGISEQLPTLLSFIVGTLLPSIIQTLSVIIPQIIQTIVGLIPLLIEELLKALPKILDAAITLLMAIVQALPTIINNLVSALPNLINTLVDTLMTFIPQLLDGAIQLLMAIVDALPTIIDSLITNLPKVIDAIIQGLVNALPLILDAAITLLMAIIQAIPTIISELSRSLPQIINTIGSTLVKNLPVILKAGIELLGGIIKAIPQIAVELFKSMPQIITSIASGLKDGFSTIVEIGGDLIKGLWNGIKDMAGWIKDKITGFGKGVLDNLKSFFGIKSPSRLMRDVIGKNLAAGIGVGFDDEMSNVARSMQGALNNALPSANAAINVNGNVNGDVSSNRTTAGAVVINQTNNYSQQHSRFEIYQSKQATAAAVRAALAGV